jgi:hypothetical protein
LDLSLGFEGVDDRDHGVAMDAEPGRDVAHPALEFACDVRAELRHQEPNAFVERGNALRPVLHAVTLALAMIVIYGDDHQ